MKKILFYTLFACFAVSGAFAQSADAIVGTWMVADGSAKIKIDKVNNKYVGKMVWLKEPTDKNGVPVKDTNNPETSLRSRTLMGLQLLNNFTYEGDNVWENGTIYDPDGGDTYSCKITFKNSTTIEVRGYVGISLFGRSETWKKCNDMTASTN